MMKATKNNEGVAERQYYIHLLGCRIFFLLRLPPAKKNTGSGNLRRASAGTTT